jgi:hypothetical protein
MKKQPDKKINRPGLWLVKFRGEEATCVIRVVYGRIGDDLNYQLLTCRDVASPMSGGVIPFFVTEANIEKVYRKIKDPLE